MNTTTAVSATTAGLMVLGASAAMTASPTTAHAIVLQDTAYSEDRLIRLEKRVTMIGSTAVVLPAAAQAVARDADATRIAVFGDDDLPTSRTRTRATTTRPPIAAAHEDRPFKGEPGRGAQHHARVPARP